VRCVIQRVSRASVTVDDQVVGVIAEGLLLLVGIARGDTPEEMTRGAQKIVELRIFPDEQGKMNRSLKDVGASVLAVSQFTLAGSLSRGRRPSFEGAEEPQAARERFEQFVAALRSNGAHVETGVFREHMSVELVNEGPVTFVYES